MVIQILENDYEYSDTRDDGTYQYRHVFLPDYIAHQLPQPIRCLEEYEWRGMF